MLARKNRMVAALGRKGSGKSQLMRTEQYAGGERRIITLDWTGEDKEHYPRAVEVGGMRAASKTLRELVDATEHDGDNARWHLIVADLSPLEVERLLWFLSPPYRPGVVGFSRAVGGLALECTEVDVIAPANGASEAFRHAVARGRHALLSFYLATRRPHECSRAITSQADEVISFRMHEPRDVKFIRDTCGETFAEISQRLPKHWHVDFYAETGTITVIDADGGIARTVPGLDVGAEPPHLDDTPAGA